MESATAPLIGSSEGETREGLEAVVEETKQQLRLAAPMVAANLLQSSVQMVSLMFVGHLGALPLAGASIATSFVRVTGFSLLMGMGSALDTLCGQAFGAKQYKLLGIYMQRAMLVLVLAAIPLAVLLAYARECLVALGQDADIAGEAATYAKWLIPALLGYGILQCQMRFLQAQSIAVPVMLSSTVAAVVHPLVCWALVCVLRLGSKGAALATSVAYWANVVVLANYVGMSGACSQTWTGFSKEALCGVSNFFRLAVPSAAMICAEWWSFEILVLLSGLLPNPKLESSVLSISLTTTSFVFMVPLGLGAAVSARISNELGAGKPQKARLAVAVAASMAVVDGLVVGLVMVLGSGLWGRAYSDDSTFVHYIAVMVRIAAISSFFDAVQSILSGVARGSGQQKIGALVNLGSYYLVGIPLAVLLAFVLHLGGKGLWIGIMGGTLMQDIFLSVTVLWANWEKQAKEAERRIFGSADGKLDLK